MNLTIFGKDIPLYGIFFFIGIAAAACVGVFLIKKRKIPGFDFTCSAAYAMIGAIIGAKLLYVLVSLGDIITYYKEGLITFEDIIKGGFVFYGGLIGGVFGLWVYGKQFKMDMRDYFDVFGTILPLGHAFGRVGCYFGGCCYGMKYDGFLSLPTWEYYKNEAGEIVGHWGTDRLPVQLMEAFVLLVLFAVLMWLFFKKDKRGLNASVYFLAYASWRFVIEFFRDDAERGVFLLSTSQWISLAIIGFVVGMYLYKRYRKKTVAEAVAAERETAEPTEAVEPSKELENISETEIAQETAETRETKNE